MQSLGVDDPDEGGANAGLADAGVCAFAADGDNVHTPEYGGTLYASGHGYWRNYSCPKDWRANVTIYLEEKLGTTWYPHGNPASGYNRLPGSGSTQRVNAKMACVNFTVHQWRSVIVVDIVGHPDTAPAATTPAMSLNCY